VLGGERNDGEKRSSRQDDVEHLGATPCMEFARGSCAGEQAHDQPNIVTCDVDQIALVDVRAAAQPGASHATTRAMAAANASPRGQRYAILSSPLADLTGFLLTVVCRGSNCGGERCDALSALAACNAPTMTVGEVPPLRSGL
jgi:hypothetical protein